MIHVVVVIIRDHTTVLYLYGMMIDFLNQRAEVELRIDRRTTCCIDPNNVLFLNNINIINKYMYIFDISIVINT